jgi:hypothetical protein
MITAFRPFYCWATASGLHDIGTGMGSKVRLESLKKRTFSDFDGTRIPMPWSYGASPSHCT